MDQWHHAPSHHFNEKGTYMVTSATLHHIHYFKKWADLDYLQTKLLELARHYQWNLEAWAIFSNHYHFISQSPSNPESLARFIRHLQGDVARQLNLLHNTPGRKVWHNFCETKLTFEKSYFARLNYFANNPVKHKIVQTACDYEFCSAKWFKENASKSLYNMISTFKTDDVNVNDNFESFMYENE